MMRSMKIIFALIILATASTSSFAQGEHPYVDRAPTSEEKREVIKKDDPAKKQDFEKMLEEKTRSLIIKRVKALKLN